MNKILITGCNGNLSKNIIKYLVNTRNYKIIGCDLSENFDFDGHQKELNVDYFQTNLSSMSSIEKLVFSLKSQNLIPDIIINNAAIDSVPLKEVDEDGLNVEYFDDYFRINVSAPIFLFKLISKEWLKNNTNGKVVNLSSIYSRVSPDPKIYSGGFIKNILYGSSKAALNNAFKQISVVYANKNIQINSLLLSGIESVFQDPIFKKQYQNRIPINRFLKVDEIFKALDLLIDKSNSYMTGAEILIDGAYSNI